MAIGASRLPRSPPLPIRTHRHHPAFVRMTPGQNPPCNLLFATSAHSLRRCLPQAGDAETSKERGTPLSLKHLPLRLLSSASSSSTNYSPTFHAFCVFLLAAVKSPKLPEALAFMAKRLNMPAKIVDYIILVAAGIKFAYDLSKSGKAIDRLVSYFLKVKSKQSLSDSKEELVN